MNLKESFETFKKAMFSGILLSIGCMAYLKVGGLIGATLFAFGLMTIVLWKVPLFTGSVGFSRYPISKWRDFYWEMLIIILGNLTGSLLSAYLASTLTSIPQEHLMRLEDSKLDLNGIETLVRAIFCGLIMSTVVFHAKNGKFLPLLYGIPIFIICGFLHSIAEMFYGGLMYFHNGIVMPFGFFVTVIIGNTLGCRLHRLFLPKT